MNDFLDNLHDFEKSVLCAIEKYRFYNSGEYPKKIICEHDAYIAFLCNGVELVNDANFTKKFHGITIDRIDRPGFNVYLCGDPVEFTVWN